MRALQGVGEKGFSGKSRDSYYEGKRIRAGTRKGGVGVRVKKLTKRTTKNTFRKKKKNQNFLSTHPPLYPSLEGSLSRYLLLSKFLFLFFLKFFY